MRDCCGVVARQYLQGPVILKVAVVTVFARSIKAPAKSTVIAMTTKLDVLRTPLSWAYNRLQGALSKFKHERNDALYYGVVASCLCSSLIFFGLFGNSVYIILVSVLAMPWTAAIQVTRYYAYLRLYSLVFTVQALLTAFFGLNALLWFAVEWTNHSTWFYVTMGLLLTGQAAVMGSLMFIVRNMEHAYRVNLTVITTLMLQAKAARDPDTARHLSAQAQQLANFTADTITPAELPKDQ